MTHPTLFDVYRAERRRLLKGCNAHREITRRFKPGAEALKWAQQDIAKLRAAWRHVRLAQPVAA